MTTIDKQEELVNYLEITVADSLKQSARILLDKIDNESSIIVVLNPKIVSISTDENILIVEFKEKLTREEIFKIISKDLIVSSRFITDLGRILLIFRNSETFICKEIISAQSA